MQVTMSKLERGPVALQPVIRSPTPARTQFVPRPDRPGQEWIDELRRLPRMTPVRGAGS